jgi:hypothetical protein
MPKVRFAEYGICLSFLVVASSGCQAFHQYRPVPVLAQDGETKKPIPGVEVRISYPCADSRWAPYVSTGLSGSDGITRLKAAPYGEAGILVEATAPGFLPAEITVPIQTLPASFWSCTRSLGLPSS